MPRIRLKLSNQGTKIVSEGRIDIAGRHAIITYHQTAYKIFTQDTGFLFG
jgi:hypothetical protein